MNILRAFLLATPAIWLGCAVPVESVEESAIVELAALLDLTEEEVVILEEALRAAEPIDPDAIGTAFAQEPVPKRPPRTPLQMCNTACDAGAEAMEAFCRMIPNPIVRLGCWGVARGTNVACKNWCYWQFTTN